MEAVPGKGDRWTTMRWYWEAGHFKHELGGLVLDRVLGRAQAVAPFGVLLKPTNVEELITSVRAQEANYRHTHSPDIEDLERIAVETTSRQKKR